MSEQKANGARRKSYKTDLTDQQWALIGPMIPPAAAKNGREPTDLREVVNTILYQNKTGCQWDLLPHDLVAKSTVFDYYRLWQATGVWDAILDSLRRKVRAATPRVPVERPEDSPDLSPREDGVAGDGEPRGPQPNSVPREETPSFVILDSQSVKTTEVGGEQRGYDGGKGVKGGTFSDVTYNGGREWTKGG